MKLSGRDNSHFPDQLETMVYAFIIHTLLPGTCKVLYYRVYGNEYDNENNNSDTEVRLTRKDDIHDIASQVHSEYQFRCAAVHRSVDDDIQRLGNEDTLPEFELGFLRIPDGSAFKHEKIVVWMGIGNTGFTLICEKTENRMLAENVLRTVIRFLQEHLRLLNQPLEAALKSDKVALVLSRFLPDGNLLFMNHRVSVTICLINKA
ncbi:hypothetical protein KUTeg_005502 [Tegillarca granosa]|uniref:Uncharacterized protein n=1 Tax=Tegillarca granosa TaxID=220873 RepID=A0ABQ9FJX8_TEGGR|nr:hypothetical protein KUTeg_005502 [Tegillarca granosa]